MIINIGDSYTVAGGNPLSFNGLSLPTGYTNVILFIHYLGTRHHFTYSGQVVDDILIFELSTNETILHCPAQANYSVKAAFGNGDMITLETGSVEFTRTL